MLRTCYSRALREIQIIYFARQDVSSSSIGLADPGPPPGARAKIRTDSETGYGEEDTGTSGETWGTVTLSDDVTNG